MAGTYSIAPASPAYGPEKSATGPGVPSSWIAKGRIRADISNVVLSDAALSFSYAAKLQVQNYWNSPNHYIESKLDGVTKDSKTGIYMTPSSETYGQFIDTANVNISGTVSITRTSADATHTFYVNAGTTGGGAGAYNSSVTFTIVVPALEKKGASVSVKVDGVWKQAKTFVKVNGVWKEGEVSVYSGGWKQ